MGKPHPKRMALGAWRLEPRMPRQQTACVAPSDVGRLFSGKAAAQISTISAACKRKSQAILHILAKPACDLMALSPFGKQKGRLVIALA